MRTIHAALGGALAAGAAAAGIAAASGPRPEPAREPEPQTVVAVGRAQARVAEPRRRTDRSVEREVRAARHRAIPRAVESAREEARALAAAAGLELGDPVGVGRDAGAPWYDADTGRFGPGRWCGPIVSWRTVRGSDGTPRRIRRSHHGCQKPSRASASVAVTFAARP